jgi:hypothetical protein
VGRFPDSAAKGDHPIFFLVSFSAPATNSAAAIRASGRCCVFRQVEVTNEWPGGVIDADGEDWLAQMKLSGLDKLVVKMG